MANEVCTEVLKTPLLSISFVEIEAISLVAPPAEDAQFNHELIAERGRGR